VKVLVTIPVWNERGRLEACVRQLTDLARELPASENLQLRIAVAEDGSTDGTKELLSDLVQRYPDLIVHSSAARMGRGRALRDLWRASNYDVLAYIDADLAMGTDPLLDCLRDIRSGADLAIGCRYAPESEVHRPPLVWFVSKGYNWLIRTVFHDGVLDHQCGLKALGPRVRDEILPFTSDDAWFWDSELIIRCHQAGLEIREIPLTWIEKKNRRTSVKRLVSEVFSFTAAIVSFEGSEPYAAPIAMAPTAVEGAASPVRSLNANR
jgi:glycosyltransferase involved in cell wall biosynthesis